MSAEEQLHHRPGLRRGHREGAPRRLPRRHRAGDPAHHRRDQAPHPAPPPRATTCCIGEVGGTVGDIESLPFLEAIRQFRWDRGRENVALRPPHAGAVHRRRRRAEDQADAAQREGADRPRHPARHPALPHRPHRSSRRSRRRSPSSATSTRTAVITAPRRRAASTRCRCVFHEEGLDERIVEKLNIWTGAPEPRAAGEASSQAVKNPKRARCAIAMVGKYVDLADSYKSLNEALAHGGIANECRVEVDVRRLGEDRAGRPARRRRRSADGDPRADGLRPARHRGQDRGGALRAREEGAVLRHLLRHADGGHRVRAPRLRPRAAPTRPRSTRRRRIR